VKQSESIKKGIMVMLLIVLIVLCYFLLENLEILNLNRNTNQNAFETKEDKLLIGFSRYTVGRTMDKGPGYIDCES
jgi:hypothetical protein